MGTRSAAPRSPNQAGRTLRAVSAIVAGALVVAACGAAESSANREPPSADTENRDRSVNVAEALTSDDDSIVFENGAPELLGMDPPTPHPPPAILAMGDGSKRTERKNRKDRLDATDDAGPVAPDRAAQFDPMAVGPAASETDALDPEPAARAVALPEPPPAASGPEPLYDDPTEMLVAASGRTLPNVADVRGARGAGAGSQGVSDWAIKVGGIVSRTVSGNPYRTDTCKGAEARYLQANTHHELSRWLDFSSCLDDTAQIGVAKSLASYLADNGFFAVAPLSTPAFLDDAAANAAALPYFGDDALPGFCGRETLFGFGTAGAVGCPVLDARGYDVLATPVLSALAVALEDGLPEDILALVQSGPAGEAAFASLRLEAELAALPVPDAGPLLPRESDGLPASWSDAVGVILAADPSMVLIDGPVIDGLVEAIRAAGYRGQIVIFGNVDPLAIADPASRVALGPVTVVSRAIDIARHDTAGWVAIEGAAASVGVAADEIGLDFVKGYVAADMLIRAIAATPEPLTTDALARTVNGGWWYPGVDGVACGSWWPASHFAPAPCVSVAAIDPFNEGLVPIIDLVEIAPQLRFALD